MKEDIIDYKEWKVPTSWDEVTLKTFQEIETYYDDKDEKFDIRKVMHILCDKTIDEVNSLPMEFAEIILDKLMFMKKKPQEAEAKNEIIIDGERYFINVMEKLKTGEYVAVDTILKDNKHDYASFLTILCRKEGEIYDSKFEAETFEERREMWLKQPIVKIMPLIAFFLQLYITSQIPTQLSSQLQEAIDHMRKSITISRANGELSALYTALLMRRLKKLEKSAKSI